MANRYAVKSATLTFGSTTYDMASGPAMKAETKDAVETTALSDQVKQFITGALKEVDEFTVSLYQKGSGDLTTATATGALTIAVTLENGSGTDATATVSYARALITKVSPPSIDASGDRKATYDVTFRPDGSVGT
jgi:hypothetical protein